MAMWQPRDAHSALQALFELCGRQTLLGQLQELLLAAIALVVLVDGGPNLLLQQAHAFLSRHHACMAVGKERARVQELRSLTSILACSRCTMPLMPGSPFKKFSRLCTMPVRFDSKGAVNNMLDCYAAMLCS